MLSPVSSKDPYTVLSISPNASADEIKQAYKRLALKWHPDRHFSDKGRATRHFIEISNAYRDLVREKRAQIDEQIPPERQRTSSNPPIAPFSSSGSPSNASSSAPSPSASVSSFGSYIHVFASSADSLEYATSPSSYQPSIHSSTKVPQDNQQSTFEPRIGNPHSLFHPTQPSYEHDQESVDNVPPTEHLSNSFRPRTTKASPSKQWPFRPFSNLTRRQSKKSNDASSPYSVLTPTTRPYSSSWYASRLGTNNVLPPPQYGLRLQSLGLGPGDEWVYSLPMTLEELYNGKRCRFGITRVLFSGKRKNVIIEINIPPGCHSGTKVLCRNIGYERKDGSFQDIAFIIEEELHPRFTRSHDDLIMDIRLPWDDDLRREGGRVSLQGLDGQNINFHIDYPRDRAMKGLHTVVGAGMPIRNTGGSVLERGNLFIQWEILPPRTRVLQFMKRIWSTQR